MENKRIVFAVFGLVVAIVGWVVELVALDLLAIRLSNGAVLYRALANLLGTVVGLFAFVWAFGLFVGAVLGTPGEPWQARLRRFFGLSLAPARRPWVITRGETLHDIVAVPFYARGVLKGVITFQLPESHKRHNHVSFSLRVGALLEGTITAELPELPERYEYQYFDFRLWFKHEHQEITTRRLEGLGYVAEFTSNASATPDKERVAP